MASLLNYTGNENLGLGSNPQIPVTYSKELDTINRTANQIMVMRAARNKAMFDQKIADRDKMIQAIDEGKIAVGNVLEEDDPVVGKALSGIDDAFADMMKKGGLNNIDAVREYKRKVQEAKSTVTQAQTRYADVTKANQEIAKETLPKKRALLQQNLDGYKKRGFWADWTPSQDVQDLSIKYIQGVPKMQTKEYTDPNDPLKKVKESYLSYNQGLQQFRNDFIENDENRENQRLLLTELQSLPSPQLKETLDAYNKRIQGYNAERGLKPGMPDYADEIKYAAIQGPQGAAIMIQEEVPDLAAKVALASQPAFRSVSSDYDKNAIDLKELESLDRYRRGQLANERNRIAIDWAKFNYAKDEDKFGAETVLNEAKDIISKGVETTVESGGKKIKVLRIGDPTLLKSFGNIDKEGNVTNVPDAIEYNKDKDQVKLVYYDENKTESGKNIISKEVSLDQRTWLKEIAKRSFPNKDIGKVNTLVDDILNNNGNSLYKLTQKQPEAPKTDNAEDYDIPKGAKVVYNKDGKILGYELNGQKFKF